MEHTARNFVLQLGALISLYVSLGALLAVLFGIITLAFPDEADQMWLREGAESQIRFGIATLIVFFPVYLALTRTVNRMRRTEGGLYLTLTKWLIYLSIFVGGCILLGDFVAVIFSFLNGEITVRFILKALALLVVIGAAFSYYALDARSFWHTRERQSIMIGSGAAAVVLAAIILGFFHIDAPQEVREKALDQETVNDLGEIEWRIAEYYRVEGVLPQTLTEIYEGTNTPDVPMAPSGRSPYEYNVLRPAQFMLCAEFAHAAFQNESIAMPTGGQFLEDPYNWEHGEGRVCFTRTIDPDFVAGAPGR